MLNTLYVPKTFSMQQTANTFQWHSTYFLIGLYQKHPLISVDLLSHSEWSEANADFPWLCHMKDAVTLKANIAASQCNLNTLRLRKICRHFADNIFKCIFLNENVKI